MRCACVTRWSRSRSAIRAEASLPAVGRLALVDPETGELVRVDSSSSRLRERFAALERERREAVAARAAPPGRPPHRPVDRPGLAGRAGTQARMSFADPLWLLALLLIPLALLAQRLSRRRARTYAVRFPAAATLQQALPRVGTRAWRRQLPIAALLAAIALIVAAIARAARHAPGPDPRGIADAGARPLGLDGVQRRGADTAGCGDPRCQHLHRPAAVERPRRRGRLLHRPRHGSAAGRPTMRPPAA